ncbi:hypothetical protein LUZ63_019888 [Rhynchospora breviuscula]|uniref:Protein FAR1-RELATED SEQUENCE n=1 Tax=Rhynchospora breviuscula TaxID=2022672 RepID=A0A9Q0HJX3_9POAL|nr:hypothetical protein LUZ63_019888 [Rhynchospora breviuscula]
MAIEDLDPHETQTNSEDASMDDTDPHADLALCPFVGKEFMTEDDAKDFYNGYAYRMGFSIRRATFYKSVKSDEVTSVSLRSHKSLDDDDKEIIKDMTAQNIEAAKIHECLAVKHGGKKFLRFKRKDISNEIAYQKQKILGVDVDSTLVYFQKKQEDDPEFFYAVDVDESGRLKNLFWVDGRARRAFQEFGDVVTFDTTYQTNKYKMPLAPFIGVNHHRMNIFFGIAMLRSEDTSGFVWLFENWVEAMYGKKPKAIITDQDPAMRIAIKEVFPNAVHRCCQWHVMRKAREHLGALYGTKEGFEQELKRVINRSMTISEFKEGWAAMLGKHGLRKNRHLKYMYSQRSEWVPAYFRDSFFANMSTSQRSESANNTIKSWSRHHNSMYQLVLHMEKIVEGRWQTESDLDIASMNAVPRLSTLFKIEKDASEFYTCKVMSVFKDILKKTQLGFVKEIEKPSLYEVTIKYNPMVAKMVPETYMVNINILEELVSCSCRGYEFEGLLCSHAIKVMHHVGIDRLPNRYIMKRWCKDANASVKRSTLERSMEVGATQEQEALRFATLKPRMVKILKMATKSCDAFRYLKEMLDIAEEQLGAMMGEQENLSSDIDTATRTDSHVVDPPVSKCKGKRKQPKRFKPPSEPKRFKPRKCSICGNTKGGHNSRTCPLKKVAGKKKNNQKDDDIDSIDEEDLEEEDFEDALEEEESM